MVPKATHVKVVILSNSISSYDQSSHAFALAFLFKRIQLRSRVNYELTSCLYNMGHSLSCPYFSLLPPPRRSLSTLKSCSSAFSHPTSNQHLPHFTSTSSKHANQNYASILTCPTLYAPRLNKVVKLPKISYMTSTSTQDTRQPRRIHLDLSHNVCRSPKRVANLSSQRLSKLLAGAGAGNT
jgi:hypothetical protein